jgi:phosphopantetheine adenylyltransferase
MRLSAISEKNLDILVVSEETKKRGEEVNRIRKKKGLKKLKLIVIPLVGIN